MTKTTRVKLDFRIVVGVLIVAISAVAGALVFSAQAHTTQMYVAGSTLTAGESVSPKDLKVVSIQIGNADSAYVHEGELVPGSIMQRTIAAGELLPVSALGSHSDQSMTHVVVTVPHVLSKEIKAGASVEIWSAMAAEQGVFAPPTLLVEDAQVVDILKDPGISITSGNTNVELLIPRKTAVDVLDALANSDVISLLPVAVPQS